MQDAGLGPGSTAGGSNGEPGEAHPCIMGGAVTVPLHWERSPRCSRTCAGGKRSRGLSITVPENQLHPILKHASAVAEAAPAGQSNAPGPAPGAQAAAQSGQARGLLDLGGPHQAQTGQSISDGASLACPELASFLAYALKALKPNPSLPSLAL